ncbi:CHAP domain-containing protein [Bifidobacterium bifidum]|uniref:CHAP domain-containing protein n=1 Tax=Bifidobacterium bifidum TaxID=1681 RepID=UPI001C22EBEF|nr:CHAP domain-containing protein [Bifidobacterium bifidum]MBU8984284.1 CHAP domain-containing protein [Bifidobacterium bifidum]MBU8987800.1 CHAP domain-containing protein [Bifidobacterium bifidum]
MVKMAKRGGTFTALALAAAMALGVGSVAVVAPPEQAAAVTEYEYRKKVSSHNSLKKQLAGVDSKLAGLIISLNDLTENRIPAAQKAVQEARQKAEQAKSLAEATAARLEAAKNDRTSLEEKIKQTGEDYDDAKDAVAQLARASFHGSDASTLMDVVTNATTTEDFVNKMQSDAAVTRSEANAADAAATSLSTSMNRKERLTAIEDEITQLKGQADSQAASAQQAAEDAVSKQSELEALRKKSDEERAQLEAQKKSLSTKAAQEAAELVSMKAEIDSWSVQNNTGSANAGTGGQQQIKPSTGSGSGSGSSKPGSGSSKPGSGSSKPGSGSGGSRPGGSGQANGMNYTVPGNCYEGMSVCYGHRTGNTVGGSAYPWSQCTWYAYRRRVYYYHLPTGSYMGNGQDWANTGRSLGYLVNRTPHVGAAMVFRAGQLGANSRYGHVAVVERVNSDGSVLISECGASLQGVAQWRTIYNAGNFQYVHY